MESERIGPYRVLGDLGAGGMGEVHLAEVIGNVPGIAAGARVAVKIIHPHLLETEGCFERFLREAEIGRRVDQENVVRTYDCDASTYFGTQHHYLVMEYVEGQTLRELLRDLGRIPEELCIHIGRKIAAGLEAIHDQGIVHRDLKPENVMITPDHVVKVMDLGVAKLKDEAFRLSKTGQFVGSLHYAAPEQFRRSGDELDGRADLYALGVVLYELATGEHPHGGDSFQTVIHRVLNETPRRVSELNPQLSPFFEAIVETLLRKDRDRRFRSAMDLTEVLVAGDKGDWWKTEARALRAETRRPPRRIRIPRETALYGRTEELGALREEFAAAQDGRGRVVLVEGEMGVGKTRLVDELLDAIELEGTPVDAIVGVYPPGGAATAAGAFVSAYRERLGTDDLDATLEGLLVESPLLAPAFAALLRGAGAPAGSVPLTKDVLQDAFLGVTQSLAKSCPVVLLIEDLQYAPPEGLALFASLAVAIRELPVLLIGTTRRGLSVPWHAEIERLDHARSLRLGRLEAHAVQELLADAMGDATVVGEIAGRVMAASDGNPYFVFEILHSLREQRVLHQTSSGAWVTTGVMRGLAIPASVEELLKARLSELEESDRSLLEVAACIGDEFDPLLVATALGEKPIPVLQRLARLESGTRLVRAKGRRFVFDHGQVKDALYDDVPELLREQYHALLGATLEERERAAAQEPDALPGEVASALLRHFLLGGEPKRGRRYVEPAIRYLEGLYRQDLAADLGRRALAAEGLLKGEARIDQLLAQAWRLDHLGRRDEEREAIAEAASLADRLGDERRRLLADKALGSYLWRVGEVAQGVEVIERAVERAAASDDRTEEAALRGNLGTLRWSLGDYEGAITAQQAALATAREVGAWAIEANALGGLGNAFWALGRHAEAMDAQAKWLALAQKHDDRVGEAMAEGNLGGCLRYVGMRAEARPHIERSLELARRIGQPTVATNAAVTLAALLQEQGHSAEAITTLEGTLPLLSDIRFRESEGLVYGMLGQAWLELGVREAARTHYERSLEICTENGDPRNVGHALHGLGMLAEQEGERDFALQHYGKAIETWQGIHYPRGLAGALLMRGVLLGEEGMSDLEAAIAAAQETEQPSMELSALGHLALLRGGSADPVRKIFDEHATRLTAADLVNTNFLLWQLTGDRALLEEARRLLDGLAAGAPAAHRESMLANVPGNREIVEAYAALDPA